MKEHADILLFLGPPGSGKGTLSHLCVKKHEWVQLSTGNLCRKHIAEGTTIGQQIDFAIKSGKLVSDSIISQMVHEWLDTMIDQAGNIILDGYPRTQPQAEFLDSYLKKHSKSVRLRVIRFALSDQVLFDRICNRLICLNQECQEVYSSCTGSSRCPEVHNKCDICGDALGKRPDDTKESLKERLKIYYSHEQNLLDFFQNRGYSIETIDAGKPVSMLLNEFNLYSAKR